MAGPRVTTLLAVVACALMALASTVCATPPDVDYPPDPVAPETARQCADLNRSYWRVIENLKRRPEMRAMGVGRQVLAGTCCMQAANSIAWCTTFASAAATWEEIHCAGIKRREAVARCEAKVTLRKSGEKALNDATRQAAEKFLGVDPAIFEKIDKLDTYRSWLDMAERWKNIGNNPNDLAGLTIQTDKTIAGQVLSNPVVREIVLDNLDRIGNLTDPERIYDALDKVVAEIQQGFPKLAVPVFNRPSPNQQRILACKERTGGVPPSCQPSTLSLKDMVAGGAECQPHGDEVWCF